MTQLLSAGFYRHLSVFILTGRRRTPWWGYMHRPGRGTSWRDFLIVSDRLQERLPQQRNLHGNSGRPLPCGPGIAIGGSFMA